MSLLVEKARCLSERAHEGQRRVGGEPYATHPAAVAALLQRYGFSEEVVAAAYAHDVLEDTNISREELEQELGSAVRALVGAVTEDKSLPWRERKERYVESVRRSSDEVKAISAADKIHNLNSLIELHTEIGERLWEIFRGKEEQCWFAGAMLEALEGWQHPLKEEYAQLVERLRQL